MKKLAVPVALMALTLVAFLVWRGQHVPVPNAAPLVERTDALAATTEDEAPPPVLLDTPTSVTARADIPAIEVDDAPPAAVAPPSAPEPAPGHVRLRGSIVVVDPEGVEHASESGALTLHVKTGNVGTLAQATVMNGRYEVDVKPGAALGFFSARLGGRVAAQPPDVSDDRPFPRDLVHDLRVQWPRLTMLHARDAHSGVELTSIEVVAYGEDFSSRSIVPLKTEGAGTAIVRGKSPLALKPESFDAVPWVRKLHVRAPGYGWAEVDFDLHRGGDVFVELEPGADLDVDVIGHDPANPVVLRLTLQGASRPMVERALEGRTHVSIDGLPIGRYTVTAEVGRWFESPVRLAKEEVELVAGGRSQVTLALAPMPKSDRASMSGVLVVPHEWNAQKVMLVANYMGVAGKESDRRLHQSLGAPTTSEGFDTYTWNFPSLLVGKYEIGPFRPAYSIVVDLPVGGRNDVRIEMPAPVDVFVRLIDKATRTDVEGVSITWNPKRPEGVNGGGMERAEFDAETRLHRFHAPLGAVSISVFGSKSGYASTLRTIDLVSGRNDVEIELQRASGIVLTMMDGDRAWNADDWPDIEVTSVDGDGSMTSTSRSSSEYRLMVTKPGRYRVRVAQPIPGFLPVDDTIVDISPSTMVPLVIPLKRKP